MKSERVQVLACDIDDCLGKTAPKVIEFSNREFGTNLTVEDFSEDWLSMWGVDLAEAARRADIVHHSDVFSGIEVMERSVEALRLARAAGFRTFGTTSRPKVLEDVSGRWLDREFTGLLDDVYFSGNFDGKRHSAMHLTTKRDLYKAIGATVVIDDQPKHCLGAREIEIESAVLFGDYKWNRAFDCTESGVIRCVDWGTVINRLKLSEVVAA